MRSKLKIFQFNVISCIITKSYWMQYHDVSPLTEQCLQKKSLQIKTGMKFHIKSFAFFVGLSLT